MMFITFLIQSKHKKNTGVRQSFNIKIINLILAYFISKNKVFFEGSVICKYVGFRN